MCSSQKSTRSGYHHNPQTRFPLSLLSSLCFSGACPKTKRGLLTILPFFIKAAGPTGGIPCRAGLEGEKHYFLWDAAVSALPAARKTVPKSKPMVAAPLSNSSSSQMGMVTTGTPPLRFALLPQSMRLLVFCSRWFPPYFGQSRRQYPP